MELLSTRVRFVAFRSYFSWFCEIWDDVGSNPPSGTWFFFVQANYSKLFMYACISYNDKKQSKVMSNLLKIIINFWTLCEPALCIYTAVYDLLWLQTSVHWCSSIMPTSLLVLIHKWPLPKMKVAWFLIFLILWRMNFHEELQTLLGAHGQLEIIGWQVPYFLLVL